MFRFFPSILFRISALSMRSPRAIRLLLPTDVVWSGQARLPVLFCAYLDETVGKKERQFAPSFSCPPLPRTCWTGSEPAARLSPRPAFLLSRRTGENDDARKKSRAIGASIVPLAGSLPLPTTTATTRCQMLFAPGLFRPIGHHFQNAFEATENSNAISRY